ncbi:MAG: baculoviral IAP repeat-containing protein, partial [Phormidium sp.]
RNGTQAFEQQRTSSPQHFSLSSKKAILLKLAKEHIRRRTFQDWKHFEIQNPSELAQAGFFYYNELDKVQCAFCLGILGCWEKTDDPFVEHRRHFPNCRFILGHPVGNIPTSYTSECGNHFRIQELKTVPFFSGQISNMFPLTKSSLSFCSETDGSMLRKLLECSSSSSSSGNTAAAAATPRRKSPNIEQLLSISKFVNLKVEESDNFQFKGTWEDLGIQSYQAARSPEYVTVQSRIDTFISGSWPRQILQKPKSLAEAGFFYSTFSDEVECFSCGISLKGWERKDNVFEQHAIWNPKCDFVKLIKGSLYSEQIKKKFNRL